MQNFDLSSDGFIQNPYPVYAAMRDAPQAYWWEHLERAGTGGMWMFCRYRDVVDILRVSKGMSNDYKRMVPESDWTVNEYMMLNTDPPEHTRLRTMFKPPFGSASVKSLEHRLGEIADSLLDGFLSRGGGDFVAEVALPMPIYVITQMLGAPQGDASMLGQWTQEMIKGADASLVTEENLKLQAEATANMTRYFNDLLKRPNQKEGSILGDLSRLMANGECLAVEALAHCVLSMVAGHETTVSLLSSGLLSLLNHPGEMRKLREDIPGRMETAINEMLRFESPLQRSTFRVTTVPVSIGGQELDVGQRISAVIAGANRDPDQFPDPDRFNIERRPNRHVSFGMGLHRCLGEKLSRAETRIVFTRILERAPEISLASGTPRYSAGNLFRRLESLPLEFS
jgi:cytochrome P450